MEKDLSAVDLFGPNSCNIHDKSLCFYVIAISFTIVLRVILIIGLRNFIEIVLRSVLSEY